MQDNDRGITAAPPANIRGWVVLRSFASYRAAYIPSDIVAGLTLAAITIPQQMATARLGGFPPEAGFFAYLAATFAFAVFGGSRVLSCGADSTITPIFAGSLTLLAATGSADYAALAAMLAMMVGVILVAAGLFRLGWVANLLSIPVTTGFFVGIAVHIIVSQLPGLCGVAVPDGALPSQVAALMSRLSEVNPLTLGIGLGMFAAIAVANAIDRRIPGAVIGLLLATWAVVGWHLDQRGVATLGAVQAAAPVFAVPDLALLGHASRLVSLSVIVAAVVMMQTAATTRAFPAAPDEPSDLERDFVGLGAGSIVAGLTGTFPVNASPPSTAVVAESGGRSQLPALITAGIIVALLTFGLALLRHVPDAALGGVLLSVAARIVRVRQIVTIWRQSPPEFWLVVATAAAIIVLPIEQGVGIGIAFSLLHGIWSTTRAHVQPYERVPGTSIWWPLTPSRTGENVPGVVVAGFPAPLSFLNADRFHSDFLAALTSGGAKPHVAVLEATGIVEIDFTAAQALNDIVRRCHEDGIAFAIARLESDRAREALTRFGTIDLLGQGRLFQSADEAVRMLSGREGGRT